LISESKGNGVDLITVIRKIYVETSVRNKPAICFWIMRGYKFEARMLDFSLESYDDYYLGKKI